MNEAYELSSLLIFAFGTVATFCIVLGGIFRMLDCNNISTRFLLLGVFLAFVGVLSPNLLRN
jgi:hypothetical protein